MFNGYKGEELYEKSCKTLGVALASLFIQILFHAYNFRVFGVRFFFFFNMFYIDLSIIAIRMQLILLSGVALYMLTNFVKKSRFYQMEAIILFALGIMVLLFLVATYDAFLMYILLEAIFLVTLALVSMCFSAVSVEASIKYFIFNVVVSGISLFGLCLLMFHSKSTNFYFLRVFFNEVAFSENHKELALILNFIIVLWLVNFLFKLGIFPLHVYVADIYEGSNVSVIFFISAVIKPCYIFVLYKILMFVINKQFWITCNIFIVFGLIGMFVSNIFAFKSSIVKRFLGYTAVSQLNFVLICLATQSDVLASIAYSNYMLYNILQIPFFFALNRYVIVERNIIFFDDLHLLDKKDSMTGFLMVFSVLSISGIPPLTIFFYKYAMLLTFMILNYKLLTFIILVLNVFNIFYYFEFARRILTPYNSDVMNYKLSRIFDTKFLDESRLWHYFLIFIVLFSFLAGFFLFDVIFNGVLKITYIIECTHSVEDALMLHPDMSLEFIEVIEDPIELFWKQIDDILGIVDNYVPFDPWDDDDF